jgi:8-oxo-dGTP pyrophosphatase MutT (NUDIX family)
VTGPPRPRPEYTVTACVLLRRDDRWLLTVRGLEVDDAAGRLGLVGGHLEQRTAGTGVLEATARREAAEETGLDLSGTALSYLESELFATDTGQDQVCVTFVALAPADARPWAADPVEVAEVGWWSADQARADPRCPVWLPDLLVRAGTALDSALSRSR